MSAFLEHHVSYNFTLQYMYMYVCMYMYIMYMICQTRKLHVRQKFGGVTISQYVHRSVYILNKNIVDCTLVCTLYTLVCTLYTCMYIVHCTVSPQELYYFCRL